MKAASTPVWRTPLLQLLLSLFVLFGANAGFCADDGFRHRPPRFAFVGLHGGVFEEIERQADHAGVEVVYLSDDAIASGSASLRSVDVLLVQHLRSENGEQLAAAILDAKRANPLFRALMLTARTAPALTSKPEHAGLLECDPALGSYYATSKDNLRRLLRYIAIRYSGATGEVEVAEPAISVGLWHPEYDGIFAADRMEELLSALSGGKADAPRVAIAVHSVHLQFQQPEVVEVLVRKFEKAGLVAFAVVDTSEGLGDQTAEYERILKRADVDAVVHTCHSRDRLGMRIELGVPHLHSMFFRKKSVDEWRASSDGLDPSEISFHVTGQEPLGAIEPHACAGSPVGGGSADSFSPIDDRIDRLVARTAAWVRLRHTEAAKKRVAVFYWDREMDKGGLMRGSATGMYLNAPRSILALLSSMREHGYSIPRIPEEDGLVQAMIDHGRQVPVHDAKELERVVREGDPVLVPVETYARWLERRVPARARKALEERWGEAPGKFMVWKDAFGRAFFVIPRLEFGNVVLLPQPMRGEAHDSSSAHDKTTCPPHHYLATYFWLEEGLHADAVVHFGTHGSEFTLPGKSVGLASDDWPDLVIGSLPNVNPWIVENLGEAAPVKRRVYGVAIGHQPPPLMRAGLSDGLSNLHDDIEKWAALSEGALRQKFAEAITRSVTEQKLVVDLRIEVEGDATLTDDQIQRVDEYLHEVLEERIPNRLHVLGDAPRPDELVPSIVCCLRKRFSDAVVALCDSHSHGRDDHEDHGAQHATELVRLVLERGLTNAEAVETVAGSKVETIPKEIDEGLDAARELASGYAKSKREITSVLDALDGKFVEPGPGRGPDRNPGVLPTGRNLYMLSPDEVPSRPSWELGSELADRLLSQQKDKLGRWPRKVAFSLSSFASFQDYGVMEAQILRTIGVEPIWNAKNLVLEFRIVPRSELGRPRVDVFCAALSYYRDNFPSRMRLIDRAIRAVVDLDEPDNYVREHALVAQSALERRAVPTAEASKLARARIFGYAPGSVSDPSYYYLVERSGDWDTRGELMERYMARVSHVYTDDMWGVSSRAGYEEAIRGAEVVLRTWYDTMTSPLSNKYTWYTGGSLALAVEHVTGKRPEYVLSDVRDVDRAALVDAEDVVRKDLRTRLFNRKWIAGMQKEGYAGANQVAVHVKNLFGWEVMRSGSIEADVWERVKSVFLDDELALDMRAWFDRDNPFALQEIAEVMLEAARKGYWEADRATLASIAAVLTESISRHGEAGGIFEAGKGKTSAFAKSMLEDVTKPAADTAEAAVREPKSAQPKEASAVIPATADRTESVEGVSLEAIEPNEVPTWVYALASGLAVTFLILLGFLRRPTV
ncbi:MAG: cobaltochelatase subunit CobN [Planctomycetes bacterium]|nr:cobaltochelatase subunit CobN [Planctomycetota bacterium]